MAGVMAFTSVPSTSAPPTEASLSGSVRRSPLVNSMPITDAPSVVPISRKKFVAAVAMPTSRAGNSFCTMSTRISKFSPRPKPITASATAMRAMGMSAVMAVSTATPATSSTKLPTMSFLYVPSLLTAYPEISDEANHAMFRGSSM